MTPGGNNYVSNVWRENIFDGTVVFCTGGGGDICSAQVKALVYLGANACIIGRNIEKTEKVARDIAMVRPGAKVLGYGSVDVRNPRLLREAAQKCASELGGIDFVIAGAAGNFLAPITQLSENAFKTVVEIDLVGAFNTLKATLPFLIQSASRAKSEKSARSGGRIIFLSAATYYTGVPLQAHALAAKAGIDVLAANTAIELGPRGVTANVIAPGPIANTEGMRRLTKPGNEKSVARIPLGRLGNVREIADATVYLFSDAGNYVNGEILVVDGGAWRTHGGDSSYDFEYPNFLLSDDNFGRLRTSKM